MSPPPEAMRLAAVRDGLFARPSMVGVVAPADLSLGALEVGQHVGIAPSLVSSGRPGMKVPRLTTVVGQAVDGGRTAERAPLRDGNTAALRVVGGLARELPGEGRIEQDLDEPCRDMEERMPVLRSGLQHADGGLAILAQPIGQDRARGPCTDDNIVERLVWISIDLRSCCHMPSSNQCVLCRPSAGRLLGERPHPVRGSRWRSTGWRRPRWCR